MNPAIIELVLNVLIKYGPEAYNRIVDAVHKPAPTAEDWKLAFATPHIDAFIKETNPSVTTGQVS